MKSTSSGFEKSRLYSYFALLRHFGRNIELAEQEYRGFLDILECFESRSSRSANDARVLEIGCGQRFADLLLFHNAGARVTGIDLDYVAPRFSALEMVRAWRANGFERFMKTAIRRAFFDPSYYRALARCCGGKLDFSGVDIRRMSACDMAFDDNTFDFAYSNAVFEHIEHVGDAWREMMRVLKPSGHARIGIHLFPSLSGGHHMAWMDGKHSPKNPVPPWDHLRENRYPAHLYMNGLTKEQYLTCATEHSDIIDIEYMHQGEELLTEDILRETEGYTREDLTTHVMIITARPRPSQ